MHADHMLYINGMLSNIQAVHLIKLSWLVKLLYTWIWLLLLVLNVMQFTQINLQFSQWYRILKQGKTHRRFFISRYMLQRQLLRKICVFVFFKSFLEGWFISFLKDTYGICINNEMQNEQCFNKYNVRMRHHESYYLTTILDSFN